ncbi:hypothetical protein M8818_001418 [Zalaria obscura]|uniref:Uncharacterized protein n=1 Tax=Zalaria obscura TaxID=2024903 RepID=A0ACC3SKP3_9PEZI
MDREGKTAWSPWITSRRFRSLGAFDFGQLETVPGRREQSWSSGIELAELTDVVAAAVPARQPAPTSERRQFSGGGAYLLIEAKQATIMSASMNVLSSSQLPETFQPKSHRKEHLLLPWNIAFIRAGLQPRDASRGSYHQSSRSQSSTSRTQIANLRHCKSYAPASIFSEENTHSKSPAPQPYAPAFVFLEQDTDRKSPASQSYAPASIASRRHFQISGTATIRTSLCLPWSGYRSQISGIAIIRTSPGLVEKSIFLIDGPPNPASPGLVEKSIFLIDGPPNPAQVSSRRASF